MRIRSSLLAASLAIPFLLTAPLQAQPPQERPTALARVIECRAIVSPDERLACFDREVAAFDAAEAAREVVVVDRQQLQRTRRSLFGLSLPDLSLFGDENEDRERVTNIETTLKSVSRDPRGKYILILDDGARWVQIDDQMLPLDPRAGHNIHIRRAALGSYLAKIEGQPAIRIRRER